MCSRGFPCLLLAAPPCSGDFFPHSLIPLTAPKVEKSHNYTGSHERSSNPSYAHWSYISVHYKPSLFVPSHQHPHWYARTLSCALPVLHGHIQTIFCLGMNSPLFTFCKVIARFTSKWPRE